jgi:hypothetical protein
VVRDAGLKVLLAGDAPGEPRSRADVLADVLAEAQATDLATVVAVGPGLPWP